MATEQTNSLRQKLYDKFGLEPVKESPREIFQKLTAFWHHFALHKRTCDKTKQPIISVFGKDCPYPVWHKDEWIKNANPPAADHAPERPFFEQLWELFRQCPIPHNTGAGNQNCEYTDDWWYGKNCTLCHSGVKSEDLAYCYRVVNLKDCQYCVFSFDSERCVDLINSMNCYGVTFALNSRQCRDSAFLFDCRNCSDCLFSWNLRDKKYCIMNVQLSKEDYEREKLKYDFSSRASYEKGKQQFFEIIRTRAWWKNLTVEQCENCSGDQLINCKNNEDCFMEQESEDCANSLRGYQLKDNLNAVGGFASELIVMSSMAQDKCYDVRFGYNVIECRNMQYSAHCFQSKDCFGCCGLVGKQYHIFNKPYSAEAYKKKVAEIVAHLKKEGVYGHFFPPYFAACPYSESLAGFWWPLTKEQQEAQGYRTAGVPESPVGQFAPSGEIPDSSLQAGESITEKQFWDKDYGKPFRITKADLKFCQENHVPLSNQYYLHRLKDNFRMIFFNGELRTTHCAKTGVSLKTALPVELDSRILSEAAYLEIIR